MNRLFLASITVLSIYSSALWAAPPVSSGNDLGNVKGGNFPQAHDIMKKKCTPCHSTANIDEALKAGKDMAEIQKRMESKGARLTGGERDVLGIYWTQNPLKK